MLFYRLLLLSVVTLHVAPSRARQLHPRHSSTLSLSSRHPRSAVKHTNSTHCTDVNSDGLPLKEDTCGVCGGDGSTCHKVTHTLTPSITQTGIVQYRSVTIPKGTRRLSVRAQEPSLIAHIALQTKAGKVVLHNPDKDTVVNYRGTLIEYTRQSDGSEAVTVQGKITAAFLITVKFTGSIRNVSSLPWVTVTYVKDVREPNQNSYTWNTGNWSICTRTCGGGVQTRQVTCERHRRRGTPVTAKDSFCEDAEGNKPSGMSLCSPFRCPTLDEPVYAWSTGPWSECSSQCGYQTRHVVCHEIIPGLTTATSDDKCDASSKPPHQKQCDGQNCQAQGCIDRISICQFALRIELIRCSVPRQRNLCCVACKTHVSISARSNKKDNRQGQP